MRPGNPKLCEGNLQVVAMTIFEMVTGNAPITAIQYRLRQRIYGRTDRADYCEVVRN
ncbi:hypothetical protein [Agrilactobacillus yilanensis]